MIKQREREPNDVHTVLSFCESNGISMSTYFKLKREGKGPREMKVGKRRLISPEAERDWRREREQEGQDDWRRKYEFEFGDNASTETLELKNTNSEFLKLLNRHHPKT